MTSFIRQTLWLALLLSLPGLAIRAQAQLPVLGTVGSHDPSTMIKNGASYFVYSDGQGISGLTTTDLRNWNSTSAIFPGGPPAWTSNAVPTFTGYFWAPDIAYFNGRYNLYYCCSLFGTRNSAIGVVTSTNLTSPVWTDHGKVVQSDANLSNPNTDTTQFNCIDPAILVDTNGTVWMSYGSYSDGILVAQIDPTTGKRLNPASVGTKVSSSSLTFDHNTEEGSFLHQHGGYYYLFVNFGGCCAGVNSTYNIRVGRSAVVTGPYLDKNNASLIGGGGTMVLESTGRFIGPGHAGILNDNGTNWFTYHYYDGNANGYPTLGLNRIYWTPDGWPALTNDWSALYTFDVNAREHLGLYNGTLQNNPAITNEPSRGNVLNLDGVTNFVSLPLQVGNASTFSAWVKWNGGPDWQRIFDFGASTTNYFFLTSRAFGGAMRFAITLNGGGGEQQINASTALPTNSWCHVAVTLDGAKGVMYLNGNPIATNSALTIRPWQTLAKNLYLGKSQFPGDPLFNGRIDSFRIFGRALSAAEIKDLAWAHPALAHRYSFNSGTTNVWDSIGMAHGTLMGNAVITNGALKLTGATGGYVNLPGGLVSGSSAVTAEFWATFGVNGNWARVFDFGNINGTFGQNYFFFSPHTDVGGQRMQLSSTSTKTYDIPGTFDNRTVHVVCIVDPPNNYAAVYTNGVLESSLTGSWPAFTTVNNAWGFIGRSMWSNDAYLNAGIDEFRIYDGRLTPEEIAVNDKFGPDALALPITLAQSNAPDNVTLSWPAYAVGFVPQTTSDLGATGAWSTVTQALTLGSDRWQLALPKTNAAQLFRLRR